MDRTSALRKLAGSRAGWIAVALTASLTLAALFTPLIQLPGYELAESLTLLAALLAGPLAVSLVARDRPFPPLRAALGAGLWLSLLVLVALTVVGVHAAVGTRCSPFTGLLFAVLLPFPTAFLGAGLAAGLAALLPRPGWAMGLYWLGLLGLLIHAAWGGYFGPQAFGYDHLLGYFPGPLYDEDLKIPLALWWFRALSAGMIGLGFLMLAAAPRLLVPGFALFLWATGPLEHRLGSRSSVEDLDRALGAVRSFQGLTIHAPRELEPKRLERLLRTAAVARAQVAAALGVPENSPVDVFFHRSPAEKAVLTGAGQTHFTKPWLGQIQTEVDAPQVLRHEMVHALAASIGGGLFGVGQPPVFNIGIVEGLAEAVDWPAERFTLDEWSAALKLDHELPEPKELLGSSAHFYAAPQAKAYTVAGSFLHWLLMNRGKVAVSSLYRSQSFPASFGASLASLSDDFDGYLDSLSVSPQLAQAAADRFRQPPIFARPCGREVAALRDEAAQAEGQGEPLKAASLFQRCAVLDPSDPRYLEGRWRTLQAAHSPEAPKALAELLAAPSTDAVVRARVDLTRGDQAFLEGRPEEAGTAYREAREIGLDPPNDRAAQIRLLALDSPDLAEPLHRYLGGARDDLALLAISEAAAAHPAFGPLRYLIGLAVASRGEARWSLEELERALALGLPDDLTAQALRVEIEDALQEQRYSVAAEDVARLAPLSRSPASLRQTEDLKSRLESEARLFPTTPPANY